MKIVNKKISDLIPYENNPRINEQAVGYVANSIKEFGFRNPIIIDGDNVIICGHTRRLAAIRLGLKEAPCICADDLTEEQVKAFRLADNKVSEFAEWDFDKLATEVAALDFDMSEFGFEIEFDDTPDETEASADDYNPEAAETRTKQGDIWQLGNHRLMCGDSTSVDDIQRLLNGAAINLVLTDPPYGVNIVKTDKVGGDAPFGKVGFGEAGKNKIIDCNTYMPIKGDETTDTAREFYDACLALNIKNFIIFGGNYFTDFLPPKACWVVWDKENTGNFADVELAWTSFDKGAKLYKFLWNGLCREGDRKTELQSRVHPTQKPVGMLGDILKDFSAEGENIFDGFGGSGSSLIACEQLNRNCFMIEYEPYYVDVIINRWESYTGKKAVLINE